MRSLFLTSSRQVLAKLLVCTSILLAAQAVEARNIYLNGIDISSARSESLQSVNLRINENGDVFVEAPHYQVNEEDTYIPLSQYAKSMIQSPMHQAPGPLPMNAGKSASAQKTPSGQDSGIEDDALNTPAQKLESKAGDTKPTASDTTKPQSDTASPKP